jgi:hypothetical protein
MFADCTADLNLIIFAVYLWTVRTREKLACQLTGLSKPTIIMVYGFPRVMCRRYFKHKPIKLSGQGVVCQADESTFTHKPMHHQVEDQKPGDGYVHWVITTYKKV